MKDHIKKIVYIILFLSSLTGYAQDEKSVVQNWNGWRGLICAGISHSDSLPIIWSDVSNIKWKTAIPGSGYSSPIVFNDNIYLTTSYIKNDNNFLNTFIRKVIIALNADNGSEIWRKELLIGLSNKTCGSSRTPLIKTIDGIDMIIIWRGKSLNAYNLSNGDQLSEIFIVESQGDLVSSLISDSLNIYLADPMCCRAINIDNLMCHTNKLLWETEISGPNIPSLIVVNKLLFVSNDRGQIYCINPCDGKIFWKEKLPGKIYFSSPIANSTYIYITDNYGLTTVIKASKTFEVISNNSLNCDIHASIVPYKNLIFIRSFNDLICISK